MDAAKLNYAVKGDGPSLVFVHGFPFDRRIWKEQVDGLSDVARVLAPDLPGFGHSALLPRSIRPSIPVYADALAAWAKEEGFERLILAGHSMGGYVALAFARQYPDMLAGLGLISTRPGPDTRAGKEGRYRLAVEVRNNGPIAVVTAMLSKLFAAGTVGRDPGLAERLREIMMSQSSDAIIAALHAMAARRGTATVLRKIKVPTLIVTGNEDVLIPPTESEKMAERVPKSRRALVTIEGAAHLPMMEAPDKFNAAFRDYLRQFSKPPPAG